MNLTENTIKIVSIVTILSFCIPIFGCSNETARSLNQIREGMSVDEVRQKLGQEDESKQIKQKEYFLYGLFKNQSAKYFGMRSHYIIVFNRGKVETYGAYGDFFQSQEEIWSPKQKNQNDITNH